MHIKNKIIKILDTLPYVRSLKRKVNFYESSFFVPPGHFYSPMINAEEFIADSKTNVHSRDLFNGIQLNKEEQFELLKNFKDYYGLLKFKPNKIENERYLYENGAFSYADVIFLFGMIHHFRPKKIVEIGSGFSSAAMLDINEQFFNNTIDLTFIEPYPETLKSVVKKDDQYTLLTGKVQDIDINVFKSLDENDILFIDSTHVVKTNSDVLYEFFDILPLLKEGVKIHIHDIFYPFEYPENWVLKDQRNWNEIYLLRAFLMYNKSFKIIAFNTYLEQTFTSWFEMNMPLCLKNTGGSIWLEKID